MASAELQGKYQKLAQEYSKVPTVREEEGSPALAEAFGCLGSGLLGRRGSNQGPASALRPCPACLPPAAAPRSRPGRCWLGARVCGQERNLEFSLPLNRGSGAGMLEMGAGDAN